MSNTSATGGYLAPAPGPRTLTQVEDVLHDVVAGITGLSGKLVRPRWQETPPQQPKREVTWCAIGITDDQDAPGAPEVQHDGGSGGTDTVVTRALLVVTASFYGPQGMDLAWRLRDGLKVEQNRAGLRAAGLALYEIGRLRYVPELVNKAWVPRVDLELSVWSESRRTYPVLNILCGPATIETETGLIVQTTPMTGEEGF